LCYEWISKRGDDYLEVHYDHDTHRIALAMLSRESSTDSSDINPSALVGGTTTGTANVAAAADDIVKKDEAIASPSAGAVSKEETVNTVNDKYVPSTEVNYAVPFNMFRLWFLSMEAAIVRYRDAERKR